MMGRACLFLVVAALTCGVHSTPTKSEKDGLCPSSIDIAPCVCSELSGKLDMDCSAVDSTEQLTNAFQATFPFTFFNTFTMAPITPSPSLLTLPHGVFGDVSFEYIYVTNTDIETIEEEAFTASKTTLLSLSLTRNRIQSFPFETLLLYTHLHFLDLTDNMFIYLPDIITNSLRYFTLTENIGLSFDEDTFTGAPNMIELNLNHMQLASIPPNVFAQLNYIENIDLSNNNFAGKLVTGFMKVPLDSLKYLNLGDNQITDIASDAITGVDRSVIIDFKNNGIEDLNEANWVHLLDQITRINSIDLRGNPLLCGCDVLWLVREPTQMNKIHENTTCYSGGMYLHDVPLDSLVEIC